MRAIFKEQENISAFAGVFHFPALLIFSGTFSKMYSRSFRFENEFLIATMVTLRMLKIYTLQSKDTSTFVQKSDGNTIIYFFTQTECKKSSEIFVE